jgi:hypothetical protein
MYNDVRAAREAKKAAYEAEQNARKAEYAAKLAEYEAEMAKIHPYQDEIDLCQALTTFLEKTYGKEIAAAKNNAVAAPVAPVVIELDGLKPLKREQDDFFVGGGRKKGGKMAAKGGSVGDAKKGKKEAKLALPIAHVQSFATLGLSPPAFISAVEESITAIKGKKEWFQNQTTRQETTAAVPGELATDTPVSPKKKSPAPVKKVNSKFNADDHGAFPSLSGGSTFASTVGSSWGPNIVVAEKVALTTDGDKWDA